MKDNRSTPDTPQPVSEAQVSNESLTNLGSPLGPDLLAGAAHEGPFNVGSITAQAQGGSVKGKKDLARSRAHITSSSVAAESRSFPKPTPTISVSKFSYGTCDRSDSSFLFTTSTSNELGELSYARGGPCSNAAHDEKLLESSLHTRDREHRDGVVARDDLAPGKLLNAGDSEITCLAGVSSDFTMSSDL